MATKDWLPTSRSEQLSMAKKWDSYLTEQRVKEWSVSADLRKEFYKALTDADKTFSIATTNDRTAAMNAAVRVSFGKLVDIMRDLRRRHFFMPPLTEADWVSLEMRIPDTTISKVGTPTSVVTAEITYPHKNALSLRIIPIDGQHFDDRSDWGFRIYFGVLPQTGSISEEMIIERQYLRRQPQNPEELTASHFTRRKRDLIEFPYDNSGKQCFICVRYENSKGDKGPWGPMVNSFIP